MQRAQARVIIGSRRSACRRPAAVTAAWYAWGMWFDTWNDLARVALVGPAAYVTLVVVLRVSGKRTLAKLNAFDLVVTVALGSVLATVLLSSDVSWAEGALASAMLAVLQLAVSWSSARLPGGRSVVTAQPTVVLRDGQPDHAALREQRLTVEELRQAVRSTGSGGFDDITAVVLESDGTLSVIARSRRGDGSALHGVDGWPARPTPGRGSPGGGGD